MKAMWRRLAALFSREPEPNWIRKRAIAAGVLLPDGSVPTGPVDPPPLPTAPTTTVLSVEVTPDHQLALVAGDDRIELHREVARWLARALMRAVLTSDGEMAAACDGLVVGARCFTLPSGAPAVVIAAFGERNRRAVMYLSEPDALRVALAVLDAVELIPAAAPAPVLVMNGTDLARQAKHPA